MKTASKFSDKIRNVTSRIMSKLRPVSPNPSKERTGTLGSLESTAYRLIGEKTERFVPLFKDLDGNLQMSGLKVNFKAYVSLTIFLAILASTIVFAVLPCLLFLVFNVPVLPALLFGLGGGLFTAALTTVAFYAYPIYRADVTKRQLEDELPFTMGYMAILTSAGVSPENVFNSLSSISVPLAVSEEAKNIVRDVNLFGSDIISALSESSKHTPSERFREMLEGLISTIHSGGNLAAYLRDKSTQYMRLKRISLKKYSDTLSMLSEFYVAILLTGPLMLVIMLTVMAMLGGGDLGLLSPDLLLNMLTYLGIPLGAIVFLIILDASSPKW
jgi:flagellar protein FlaJ